MANRVKYLLDTNAISDLMQPVPRVENLSEAKYYSESPSCRRGRRRAELEQDGYNVLATFACEPVPERAGAFYATLKLARMRRGLALDENDLWIAATALALGATLVSRDSDFAGIDGLSVVSL